MRGEGWGRNDVPIGGSVAVTMETGSATVQRGQSLAAEAEGADSGEVGEGAEFGRVVLAEGEM